MIKISTQPGYGGDTQTASSAAGRVSSFGPLSRNEGVEKRLLEHVLATTKRDSPAEVIAAVDSFAWGKEWMMNVGDRKGALLDAEVCKVVAAGGKTFLEVGTYCGYSATRMAAQFAPGSSLYSLEINPENASIAQQLLAHAGLESTVHILTGTVESCAQMLQDKSVTSFDLIFIDHQKEQYIPDLKILMEKGFLHPGTVVVADNLICPGNPAYIKWMEDDPQFHFTLYRTQLEYSDAKEDAVGVSVFCGAKIMI